MTPQEVLGRIDFAENRLRQLLALNGGDLAGANVNEKQQLIEEFFFHLAASTEMLAQLVNEKRSLGVGAEDVSARGAAVRLNQTDPVRTRLEMLAPKTKGQPLPADPYNDEGYIFRIVNYRNQVAHRGHSPFFYRLGDAPPVCLFLDPRTSRLGSSKKSIQDELAYMLKLIRGQSADIIKLI